MNAVRDGRMGSAASAWVAVAVAVAALAGCGEGDTPAEAACTGSACGPVTLQSLAIAPATPSLPAGTQQSLTAQATFTDGTRRDVTAAVSWSVSDAGVVSVVSPGVVRGVAPGSATVAASIAGVQATASITVTEALLTALALTPEVSTVPSGAPVNFTATGSFSDGSTRDVTAEATWSSSDPAVASVSAAGIALALQPGTTSVSAGVGVLSATATLTVTPASLTSLALSPAVASVPAGATQAFTAQAAFSDGSSRDVTASVSWSVSLPAVAAVTSPGLVRGLAVGTATVSTSMLGLEASATLTVTDAVLVSLAIAPDVAVTPVGVPVAFTATGAYSDGSSRDVTRQASWSAADASIATLSPSGVATPLRAGSTTVGASLDGAVATSTLTVQPVALLDLVVTPSSVTLPAGLQQSVTVIGTFSDTSTQDVTAQVSWTSSDASVASASAGGVVTGVAPGAAQLTAAFMGREARCDVTVTAALLTGLSLTPASATVAAGYTVQLAASGTFSDGSTRDVTGQARWTSGNAAVATVATGPGPAGQVRAVAPGTTLVTASLAGVSASAPVAVTEAQLAALSLSPSMPSSPSGLSVTFAATGVFSDGTVRDVTTQVTWASSEATVATIDGAGLARALRAGTTTVTATHGDVSDATLLTVTDAVLLSVEVNPPEAVVAKGTSAALQALGNYSDGSVADVTPQVTWTSSGGAVSVSVVQGVAMARGEAVGTATVTAALSGLSGTAVIDVTPATLTGISVAPATGTLPVGLTAQLAATGSFSDGTTQDLTTQVAWSSSDVQVASVTAGGLVTALAPGAAQVTASLQGLEATHAVTVTGVTIQSIALSMPSTSLPVGYRMQARATGTFSDGSTADVTTSVVWSSSSTSVASVSNSAGSQGLVTAVAAGTTTIAAALGGVSASADVTVAATRLASLAVEPRPFTVQVRQTVQLQAIGTFEDGSTLDVSRQCTWGSSSRRIARVSTTGLVTGVRRGSVTIRASKGNVGATAAGTVD